MNAVLTMRAATEADLPAILAVEASWPEVARAGSDKFLARLRKFPEGFFVASVPGADGQPVLVATITSMPMHYRAASVGHLGDWDVVTNHGYLPDICAPDCNALYIVSGVIDAQFRGLDIFAPMVLQVVALAQRMSLRYVLAGAVIPGYRRYCEQFGDVPAAQYCATRRGRHWVDPLLALYESIGFEVPDAQHVLADYFPDDASLNYSAMVVRDLLQQPLITSPS